MDCSGGGDSSGSDENGSDSSGSDENGSDSSGSDENGIAIQMVQIFIQSS